MNLLVTLLMKELFDLILQIKFLRDVLEPLGLNYTNKNH